jgi:hypothetical protein
VLTKTSSCTLNVCGSKFFLKIELLFFKKATRDASFPVHARITTVMVRFGWYDYNKDDAHGIKHLKDNKIFVLCA